ncbi:MAG: hypothetical protein GOMPHAMPRED_004101 [Gomphillus americanus]|uniref:DUF7820 domain-containing protein n=1 Tax=Gomphillus americanus TaxID=1940652 RepID=A0A8H3FNU2_9LECA|nr:MAG: hypothetical protein GOMPHAMPRED_004101 [Gomphillus americanus]
MANPQRRISQRPSRDSSASSRRGEDIFSDEHEINSFGVADGQRPIFTLQDIPSSHRTSHQRSSIQNTTSPARDSKKKQFPPHQSSQPLISRNSFSLQHDTQYSDTPRRIPSISSPADDTDLPAARPLSLLSRQSTYARPQSTYNGPSAPSHPYGMYPQNANDPARHASIASSHRHVRERSYIGGDRPTHPYGMYPQNTVADNETDTLAGSADIASIGFPGLRQQFARRLGPSGDDADDIIGPDGHTEQLPPYTKYPNVSVSAQKARMSSVPLSPIPQEPSQVANSATSVNDTLLSPTSTSMREPILISNRLSNLRTRNRWNEKSGRRTCFGRMPLWLVVLIIFLMVAIGAVGGAVLGHFIPKWKHNNDKSMGSYSQAENGSNSTAMPPPPPNSSALNPSPTAPPASPSNLTATVGGANAAPTGIFSIIISSSPQKSDTCLEKDEQKVAWACTNELKFQLNVENPLNGRATVTLSPIDVTGMFYGDQNPPFIQAKVDKQLVKDPDNPDYGKAYYFSNATYDKQVILPQTDLVPSTSKRSEVQQLYKRSSQVQENDMVWNCYWNDTLIDGFIYVDDVLSTVTSSSSPPAPTNNNSKRHLIKRESYSRKMKIREIRQNQAAPPQCTLMQYINQSLVPSTQQPPILLDEIPLPRLSVALSHWHQDWSKHRNKDDHDDDDHAKLPSVSFCDCAWIFG